MGIRPFQGDCDRYLGGVRALVEDMELFAGIVEGACAMELPGGSRREDVQSQVMGIDVV